MLGRQLLSSHDIVCTTILVVLVVALYNNMLYKTTKVFQLPHPVKVGYLTFHNKWRQIRHVLEHF